MFFIVALSESQKRATAKYNKKNYKRLTADIKPSDYDIIDNYCKDSNISKASLIVTACKEYINNHSE